MLGASRFVQPCLPTLRKEPPTGGRWRHEVKFDGWRLQLHKVGNRVVLYSKKGYDFTHQFPHIEAAGIFFPARHVIIDAEIAACGENGMPDFSALLNKSHDDICIWCFDLLAINGKDLRTLPYIERKAGLARLVERTNHNRIRYSEYFDNAEVLIKACARMKLEGIVSKLVDSSYRSGPSKEWIKVKCLEWREDNRWRHEFFERNRR